MDAKGRTILLVEDDEYVFEVGMMMLQKLGFDVLGARSGGEAVAVYRANQDRIDLVFLDLVMPEMSGAAVFESIKSIKPDVDVLVTTGFDLNDVVVELLQSGCRGFIQKPFTFEKLSDSLAEILN